MKLQITGMHCGSCVGRVQQALAPLADTVSVTLTPPRAELVGGFADLALVQAALSRAGAYTAALEVDVAPAVINSDASTAWPYKPLAIIAAFIVGVSLLVEVAAGGFSFERWMRHFMAGFFIVFGFFKCLDIPAFARAYAGYDLIAARFPLWGSLYPFVELSLGAAYLLNWNPLVTNLVCAVVMAVSLAGVVRAVMSKQRIQCACLGTVFQLPMSSVTIIEDGLMLLMALGMLVMLV
jgi:copper chaperone CopZ